MKRRIILLAALLVMAFSSEARAFDCYDFTGDDYILPKTLINSYQNYATSADNINYSLCFKNDEPFVQNEPITINVAGDKKLIIVGLKLTTTNSTAPLLTLSGNYITLDSVSTTGNGSGTAIQVNGANIAIKNSVISNFKTGISIINADGLALENITFALSQGGKNLDPAYLFDPNFFGKKCDKRKEIEKEGKKYEICDDTVDANIVIKVAGKPPMGLETCTGNIDVYKFDGSNGTKANVASCPLKLLDADKPLYFAKYANSELTAQEIKAGECAFECEVPQEKQLSIKYEIVVTYNGIASFFKTENDIVNAILLFNNADVPSLTGTFSIPDAGSETDGGTIIVADNTGDANKLSEVPGAGTGPNIDGGGGTGQPKATTGDGGLVNKEAGSSSGCGMMGEINPSQAKACYSFIFSLFGLAPIAWRRIRK